MNRPRYSVVVPVFNEEEVLPEFHRRLSAVLDQLGATAEIVFVNDGSVDGSLELLKKLHAGDARVRVVSLSRNFGHQTAVSAGLQHARGDVVAVLDGDLQDPPEVLPRMFELIAQGADVAYGVRTNRKEGWLKRTAYFTFYRLLQRLSDTRMPLDAGDFSAMSRRVVDLINGLGESDRYIRGLRSWVGFRQVGVPYGRDWRQAGQSKYTLGKLLKLSLDGIVAFSYAPLRLIVVLGFLISLTSFFGILVVIYRRFTDVYVPGWASMSIMLLFLGGIQLLTLGLIGEYVGRIFQQVKARPLYVVDERVGFEADEERKPWRAGESR